MKNLLLSGLMLGLGFLSQGHTGIEPDYARSLGLPDTYYFREVPYAPEKLNDACVADGCPNQDNFILNQEVTGA